MAILIKHKHINFKPPVAVAKLAAKGLKFHTTFKRGGTAVGIARARDLKNRKNLSPSTIKRMVSYFARHQVDKRSLDFGNEIKPSNGYIAWLLWGGDAGRAWASEIKQQMLKLSK